VTPAQTPTLFDDIAPAPDVAKKKKTKKKAGKAPKPAKRQAAKAPARAAPERRRATAQSMAERQREISVSEFFTKNRHLLGFDSPLKALLTAVKEAVDNSLDACEEAGILPEIFVEISQTDENRYRMAVEAPGSSSPRSARSSASCSTARSSTSSPRAAVNKASASRPPACTAS